MSIPEQTLFVTYAPNGVTVNFTFPFTVFSADDLLVELDGVELTSGFTVSGIGASSGSVTFAVAPTGTELVIKLQPSFARTTDYQDAGDLLASTVDKDFDKLWQALQYLQQELAAAIKLPFETSANQEITASAAARINKIMGFDASGDLALLAATDLDITSVSNFIATLLDDTTASAALTTLGVSTYAKTLLDDATAADAQTTLGISAFAQTLLDDASAYAVRNTLRIAAGEATSGIRQTVQAGNVVAGAPSFLPSTSASLSITSSGNTTTPLIVTAAKGFGTDADRVGIASTELTWSSLSANNTNYLYVDVASNGALTTGSTILAPLYLNGVTAPSTTDKQCTFDINAMIMYVGNGSTASSVYRVFVGEAVTNGSTVTSATEYAYNGKPTLPAYASGSALPAASSAMSFNHNIGTDQINAKIELYCATADATSGYAAGDIVENVFTLTTYAVPFSYRKTRLTVAAQSSATAANVVCVQHKTTGAASLLTLANWKYRINVARAF